MVDLVPTETMANNARRGLEMREEFGRHGRGVARARDIANRKTLSPRTINRMVSFFARHEVDKEAEGFRSGEPGYPSAGKIAWMLWGSDAAYSWAKAKQRALENEKSVGEPMKRHLRSPISKCTTIKTSVSSKATPRRSAMRIVTVISSCLAPLQSRSVSTCKKALCRQCCCITI